STPSAPGSVPPRRHPPEPHRILPSRPATFVTIVAFSPSRSSRTDSNLSSLAGNRYVLPETDGASDEVERPAWGASFSAASFFVSSARAAGFAGSAAGLIG